MNGLGGGNAGGAMMGLPTPAGHQAELNYIYGMVEELSRQLADNKRALEEVVSGIGRVRTRARTHSLSNRDLIEGAAEDLNGQDQNLDALISVLYEALDKAKYSRDANAALLSQYAAVISNMLKQFHEYKAKHVGDVAAWHRSYRAQLAEARAENSRLREQIWEMQERAGRANELLRRFRTAYEDDDHRHRARVDCTALRQELRFWKRMALPELPDDDPYWSDDDDLIDPAEKRRLRELEAKAAQDQLDAAAGALSDLEGSDDGDGPPRDLALAGMMGGVPMERQESATGGTPLPPPRPSSAASTGSSGQ
ncbi:hypothetical protein VTK73DRAFT_3737 [Phialemonium thermophilum]|uniref:Uncharacterized protein n=1 Tax=Phialemonium thermophilum TaxID=223376 RepID=A0ABR3Y0M1_9PEZI